MISFVLVLSGLLIHVKPNWPTTLNASGHKDVSVQDCCNMYTFDEDFPSEDIRSMRIFQ